MAIISEGTLIGFALLVLAFVLFYLFMYLARTGYKISARTFPAVVALPEAVGRAAEMGKPIYYTTGLGPSTLNDPLNGLQILAGISILGYVTRLAVKSGVRVNYYTPVPDSLPLVEETMRTAYLAEGKPEEFDPNLIYFAADQDSALTASLGFIQRERPASSILLGGFYYESVVLGEAGNIVGALQIGGTANTHQMPFMVATCDYMLLSEELYAASATIAGDPDVLGSLKGEDILKMIILLILVIGVILSAAGVSTINDILKV